MRSWPETLIQVDPAISAPPVFEREAVLQWLLERAGRAAQLRGQVVVLSGEAGVGKSTVIEALLERLPSGVAVAWGRCDALFTPRQLGPLYDMAPVLGAPVQTALTAGVPTAVLYPLVLQALSRLPPGSLLVFEDVHWADHASLDLLKFIARRLAPLRVMIVLTHRSDEVGPAHPLTQLLGDLPAALTGRQELQPLSAQAVQAMARHFGRDAGQLHSVTGGNAFFVSEVLSQPAPADGGVLPASVRDAVLARVARLDASQRELLETLSVAPDPVSPELIERLGGEPALAAAGALQLRGLLVREGTQSLRFRHELARRALLDSLPLQTRQKLQRRLLDVVLALGDAIPPDLIVHHAAELGDAATLLLHAPRAAARAAALGAHKEAAAMLGVALRHVQAASPGQAAQLYEDWSYETGLFEVTDAVFDARRQAVTRWRALGRPDRVGENLRWLWRLHWYRGESAAADAAAAESLAVLEAAGASAELARAYALRSHVALLGGRRAESVEWGSQAIDMAERFDDRDTQVQTLVTVATAQLFSGDAGGRVPMDEALRLALAHGFHEQAARIYTNYSEYAIVTGDWPCAERLVLEGLAFDIKHGLDSWTSYLSGRHAQLRLEQGRMDEAETLARGALAVEGRTVLMRQPALAVLARLRSRRGADDGPERLQQVLQTALGMGEQQRLTPVRLASIEHHYLRDEIEAARSHLAAMLDFGTALLRPWDAAALRLWGHRLDAPVPASVGQQTTPAQALELAGEHEAAARLLDDQGWPFEAAVCRLAGARAGQVTLAQAAAETFERLGCEPGVHAAHRLAQGLAQPAAARRGPYQAARRHPLGLTSKEVQVLALMIEGASNADIATRLSRSQRTVEHHVSSVLAKLNAANRLEAVLRVMAEPWIAQPG
jgi:DNA-binding CsgD family transcriptional regulator